MVYIYLKNFSRAIVIACVLISAGMVIPAIMPSATAESAPPLQWNKTYAGNGNDYTDYGINTSDGGYLLVGTEIQGFSSSIYVLKADARGNKQWERLYNGQGSNNDHGHYVLQTPDDGYVIVGDTEKPVDQFGGNTFVYLLKIDATGTRVWDKTYGQPNSDNYMGDNAGDIVLRTNDGGFLIAGQQSRKIGLGKYPTDIYLVKTSADGTLQWEQTFNRGGDDSLDYPVSVEQVPGGGYIIASNTVHNLIDDPGVTWIICTDDAGKKLWDTTIRIKNETVAQSVRSTGDGGSIISGYTYTPKADDCQAYLTRFDANGKVLWQKTYGDFGNALISNTEDNGYILGGVTSAKPHSPYLARTGPDGTVRWKTTFTGAMPNGYSVNSVLPTSEGGYALTGFSGVTWINYNHNNQLFIIRYGSGTSPGVQVSKATPTPSSTPLPPLPPDTPWSKTYGGFRDDAAMGMASTADGGYVMTGTTSSYGNGICNAYLVKTDVDGNPLWTMAYGGTGKDGGQAVKQTTDGGYILAGYTDSYGNGSNDFYLVKTDQTGKAVWSKTFGGPGNDIAHDVQQTTDGGYVVAGTRGGANSSSVIALVKTDANGNLQWNRSYGGEVSNEGYTVNQTSDGGYVIGGEKGSTGWQSVNPMYVIKTDKDGNLQWDRTYFDDSMGGINSVRQTSDGGYVFAGIAGASWNILGNPGYAMLVKTDQYGNTQWSLPYDDKRKGGTAYSVVTTSDGGYVMTGNSLSEGKGLEDVYVLKVDRRGTPLWSKTYGDTQNEYGKSIVQSADGGYVIAGATKSFGTGGLDALLIKINSDRVVPSGTAVSFAAAPAEAEDTASPEAGVKSGGGAGSGCLSLVLLPLIIVGTLVIRRRR